MDNMHPVMRAALAPFAPPPMDLQVEVTRLTCLVKSLKLQQHLDAEFIKTIKADAYRYRHLRDYFALNSGNDTEEFAQLAVLTGGAFDAVIDKSMADAEEVML